MRFVIVTPVRNEGPYIRATLECMSRQTLLPREWIVVDDGSSDGTGEEIGKWVARCPFLQYVRLEDRGYRKPGQGVVEAFYEGYGRIQVPDYEILAKLDGDLQFPPDTLERIADAFRANARMGITGGTLYERPGREGAYRRTLHPAGNVRGATKFYRRECFEAIGGLVRRAGWDGVDILRANMAGWETGEIPGLRILHLKPTGTARGEGVRKACEKYGDVSYYMGGYFWYFLLRAAGRSAEGRNPRIGFHMLRGYFLARRNRIPREPEPFRAFLKKRQVENLKDYLRLALGRKKEAA